MRHERRPHVLEYKGHTETLRTLGWWCESCGEGILQGPQLQASQRAYVTLKAGVDGVLSPDEVATIRGKLGLSQRRASQLLGGGRHAFQKYETGNQAVSVPMSNLLRLLDNDPTRLAELVP